MAVTSFIPTVWAAQIQQSLKKKKVSQNFVNHNYEGEVMNAGSVKINNLTDITLRDYTNGTPITYEDPSTTDLTLNIDHEKYFAVRVDDVDEAQTRSDLMMPIAENGANALADDSDTQNFKTIADEAGIVIGTDSAPEVVTTSAQAKALLLKMKKAADKANVPTDGRVFVADYDFENLLLSDPTINVAAPTAEESLVAGVVGKLYGIMIYSSNNLTATDGNNNVALLTHPSFTTEAEQLNELEALRSETTFSDVIRALIVSGRKVTMPAGVVKAIVSYTVGE